MFEIITIEQLLIKLNNYHHTELHVHHTWKPEHKDFNGSNGLQLQQGMRNYHVNSLGWADIGQHVTLLPDGSFVTGRDFGQTPASISGYNTGGFACEMLGNFDIGNDVLEGKQKDSILRLAKYFNDKNRYIRFHRENAAKTCPGTSIDKAVFMNEVVNYGTQPVSPTTSPSRGNTPTPTPLPVEETALEKAKKYVGDRCLELQKKINVLIRAGLLNIPLLVEDSDFGAKSYNAVIQIQQKYGLTPDGLSGFQTFQKLDSIIAEMNKPKEQPKPSYDFKSLQNFINAVEDNIPGKETLSKCPIVKYGSRGNVVKWVQNRLVYLGYSCVCDGIFGNATKLVVIKWQNAKGLTPDAIIGNMSWRKLLNL